MTQKYVAGKFVSNYPFKKFVRKEFRLVEYVPDINFIAPDFELQRCARQVATGYKPLRDFSDEMADGGFTRENFGYYIVLGLYRLLVEANDINPEMVAGYPMCRKQRGDVDTVLSEKELVLNRRERVKAVERVGVDGVVKGIYFVVGVDEKEKKIPIIRLAGYSKRLSDF